VNFIELHRYSLNPSRKKETRQPLLQHFALQYPLVNRAGSSRTDLLTVFARTGKTKPGGPLQFVYSSSTSVLVSLSFPQS